MITSFLSYLGQPLVFFVGIALFNPKVGYAQEIVPAPKTPVETSGIDAGKWLALGAGVVVGSFVLETIGVGRLSGIIGGVTGGLIGSWWYRKSQASPTINKTRYQAVSGINQEIKAMKIVSPMQSHLIEGAL